MGRIFKVEEGITWEVFKEKYRKHFPFSVESKRLARMASEFRRLTGREPVDEKQKKRAKKENIVSKVDSGAVNLGDQETL